MQYFKLLEAFVLYISGRDHRSHPGDELMLSMPQRIFLRWDFVNISLMFRQLVKYGQMDSHHALHTMTYTVISIAIQSTKVAKQRKLLF